MFSVIIPLYNKEKYVQKAVQSVLSQSFNDFELIIINDGSTDNSLKCLEIFEDERLKIISQNNAGVSTARNKGVELAKNEFIAFLDADDWWHEDFLKEMALFVQDFPEAALYSTSYFKVKNGQNICARIGVEENFKAGYIDYYNVYAKTFWVPVNCSFVIVKKAMFLEERGFNPKLKFGEDLDLWLRISLHHKFAFLNKCLVFSNQDVAPENRAMGVKIWPKSENVFFNLDYFKVYEKENASLKFLLEGLKMRSLHDYYRRKEFRADIKEMMKDFDFSGHGFLYRFYYKYPYWMTAFFLSFKELGSNLKQKLNSRK